MIFFIKNIFRYFVLSALFFLVACQTPKNLNNETAEKWLSNPKIFKQGYQRHSELSQWRYSAKVGVITPNESNQANMIWQFDNSDAVSANHMIRLFGPLGIGAVKIEIGQNSVQLSDRTGVLHQGDSAQELLRRIVGWPIPVDALKYWLFSLPQPGHQYKYKLDEQKQLQALNQFGWNISYSGYRDYLNNDQLLSRKIVAKKQVSPEQAITVTLVTKSWR